jgi:hypothetical protein
MDRVKDGGVGWRQTITPYLHKLGILVFDPTCKPTFGEAIEDEVIRQEIVKCKKEEAYTSAANLVKPLRTIDLRMVDVCDFIICNLDTSVHATGTYEELFWANREKKPILIHVEQGKQECPHWLFGTVPHQHIFSNWGNLRGYLYGIASGQDTDTYKRWAFFDLKRLEDEMLKEYGKE